MVPTLPVTPGPAEGLPITGGQYAAQVPLQFDLVGVSGANQYKVKPRELLSTGTPWMVAIFRVVPDDPLFVGSVAATEITRTTKARAENALTTQPMPGMLVRSLSSSSTSPDADRADWCCSPGATAS